MPLIVMPTLATALGTPCIKHVAKMIRRSMSTAHRVLTGERPLTIDEFNSLMRKLPDEQARAVASVAFDGTPYRVERISSDCNPDGRASLHVAVDLVENFNAANADRFFTVAEAECVLPLCDKLQAQLDAIRGQVLRRSARMAG